jgi:deferrochelatase/peroxidase EfeB
MTIEVWDRQPLGDQEDFVGRTKATGAPLSGGGEFTKPDFDMPGSNDLPVIAPDAHVRIVHPDFNGGARMPRRGYNFVDGSDAVGGLDAGLFFLAFVRNPDTHFVPIQTKMAANDALMEYLKVTGSALFAVPPGIGEGEYVGQALFANT